MFGCRTVSSGSYHHPDLIIWVTPWPLQMVGPLSRFMITIQLISGPHNALQSPPNPPLLLLYSPQTLLSFLPTTLCAIVSDAFSWVPCFISLFHSSFQIPESISFVPRHKGWWLETVSQIKFAPLGRGHDGTVEGEREERKLEEKAHFLCITVSFLRVYSGGTPTPLSLFPPSL